MTEDQVTLADAFAEVRKRWMWVVVAMVLGVVGAYALGRVRSNDEWAASHRLRLVAQSTMMNVNGLPVEYAANRSAKGEASYLTSSGLRDFFGDDTLGVNSIKVNATEDDLGLVINVFAPTAEIAKTAANKFRDAYVARIVDDDNARFEVALNTEQVRSAELEQVTAGSDVPAALVLERVDAAARVEALEQLPTDGSMTILTVGDLEGPVLLTSGRATRRQEALAGLGAAVLAAFLLGVRGLRSPRVRYASDVGNEELARRVIGLAPRPKPGDLDLMARILERPADTPLTLLEVKGSGTTAPISERMGAAGRPVVTRSFDDIASIDPGSQVVVVAGHRRTSRAHLRRAIHELGLVGASPDLVVLNEVPRAMSDSVEGNVTFLSAS